MTGPETPVLEPERIAAMRRHVLDTVEADRATAAGRARRRKVLWACGAAAAVAVIGGVVVPQVTGAPSGDSATSSAQDQSLSAPAESDSAGITTPDASTEPFTSTVVATGSMRVRVNDTERAVDRLESFAAARGGRLDGENVSTSDGRTVADVVVRVPGEDVSALRSELDRLGTVESVEVSRTDVATQIADVDARIESLQASIARLRAIIAAAPTTKDLLDAEQQLQQRQSDLESLQAQRRVLRDQTSLATITVTVDESPTAAAVEPSGFVGGLTRGWNGLVAATNAAVTALGLALPWLAPLAVVGGLVLLVRHRPRRP